MRKIFLDCGTHLGQGLEKITRARQIDNSWEIYTWEANPYTYEKFIRSKKFPNLRIASFNKAINSENGSVVLNIEHATTKHSSQVTNTGQGTTILNDENWRPNVRKRGSLNEQLTVESIDISEWIRNNCNKNDFIILKLDIEGAEYNVLEKLIETRIISYINEIFVEWHGHFLKNSETFQARESNIKDFASKQNITIIDWI